MARDELRYIETAIESAVEILRKEIQEMPDSILFGYRAFATDGYMNWSSPRVTVPREIKGLRYMMNMDVESLVKFTPRQRSLLLLIAEGTALKRMLGENTIEERTLIGQFARSEARALGWWNELEAGRKVINGGRMAAQKNKQENAQTKQVRNVKIVFAAVDMLRDGTRPHDLASKLAARSRANPDWPGTTKGIRNILQESGLLPRRKREVTS